MRAYLQRCRERNIQINLDKCKFLTEEVTYMGHRLTNTGLKPDEEKVRAITEFSAPRDLHHLKRFLGMVKYLLKFHHSLTTKCEPLNWLTQKDQVFQWVKVQQRVFEDIKKAIANTPVLAYNDLEKPDTNWHVRCRRGNCPLAEWETSVIRNKGLEGPWKKLCINWKRDESCCVWITQV